MAEKKRILYIGGFQLPDKNAAAHRVIGIARLLKDMGHDVVFYNEDSSTITKHQKEYYGFVCIEGVKSSQLNYLFTARTAKQVIDEVYPDCVIAYNYPGESLLRIIRYCHNKNIICIADATEWYEPHGSIIHKIVMHHDISVRMKKAHLKVDGVIAISRYLYDYYRNNVRTILLPPLVDAESSEWKHYEPKKKDFTEFVYAGSPSAEKERLDLVVSNVEKIAEKKKVQLTIVGVTEEQYYSMYHQTKKVSPFVKFLGRVSHDEAIAVVKEADWSIILRDNNHLVRAGFPTKLVESISCGTPVIINDFSNVLDYLDDSNSIITEGGSLDSALMDACEKRLSPDVTLFDYRRFVENKDLKNFVK